MPSAPRYCRACHRPLRPRSTRRICPACQDLKHPTSGHRKIKRALIMLIAVIFVALVLEGLWAAGVIAPHAWLMTIRRQTIRQSQKQPSDYLLARQ